MEEKHQFRWMWWSSFCWTFGVSMYQGMIGRYALDSFQLSALTYGWLDSVREWPGLGLVLLLAVLAHWSARRLWVYGLLLTILGLWLHPLTGHLYGLLGITLLYSTGVHLASVVRDVLTMSLSRPEVRARRLGQLASGAAAAGLLGLGTVVFLSGTVSFQTQWLIAGSGPAVGAILSLPLLKRMPKAHQVTKGWLFRWQYRSYYGLALLSATREMVTLTFVVFLLLREMGFSERELSLLLATHGLLAILVRPWIGAWIDRVGEERALAVNYATVTLLFLGYVWFREPWLVAVLFVVDRLLVALDDIALSTYVSKRVEPAEWTTTLAMGSTIAHGFAVLMPVVGGALWVSLGAAAPFLFGALVTAATGGCCVRLAGGVNRKTPSR